jgi:ATP-dependent DNA ligase
VPKSPQPPKWIKPQLRRLVDEAPAGPNWLHEVKYDGYRMHTRLADGKGQLLTRTGPQHTGRGPPGSVLINGPAGRRAQPAAFALAQR